RLCGRRVPGAALSRGLQRLQRRAVGSDHPTTQSTQQSGGEWGEQRCGAVDQSQCVVTDGLCGGVPQKGVVQLPYLWVGTVRTESVPRNGSAIGECDRSRLVSGRRGQDRGERLRTPGGW